RAAPCAADRDSDGDGIVTRILYVEDNEDNAYLLKTRLEMGGRYAVVVARDGSECLALAATDPPDVILLDLDLPVLDGWEAARRLKADPRPAGIPIIALTAHAMAGDREKALAAGCDEFDTKPVDFERLLAKVERVLAKGRPRH